MSDSGTSTPQGSRHKPTRAKQLGVDDARYRAMLEAQGGGCAICGSKPRTRRLHVDHDHKTGRVRGLLCYADNRLLPSYATAPRIDAALRYLLRHELTQLGRLAWVEEDRGFTSPCWIWSRAIASSGYGVIRYRGELRYLHRLMFRGVIPDRHQVHHRCGQRACVNPDHLEALTAQAHADAHRDKRKMCKRGHEWTEANTYLRPDGTGRRQCRACISMRTRGEHKTLRRTAPVVDEVGVVGGKAS